MSTTSMRSVLFISGSPGPQPPARQLELQLVDGRPPRMLSDPTADYPGDWLLAEQSAGDLVYRRVAPRTTAP